MTPAPLHLVTDQPDATEVPPGRRVPQWDVPMPLTGPDTAPPPIPVDAFPASMGDMVRPQARPGRHRGQPRRWTRRRCWRS
ncbi:hypothetical protein [Micromonospora vulcania]|uniref:Uncharacterized protein n=1 Tax=Micromonospora vulcania TaxID=1441873 RepID=A0ABW1H2B6_9ACTN